MVGVGRGPEIINEPSACMLSTTILSGRTKREAWKHPSNPSLYNRTRTSRCVRLALTEPLGVVRLSIQLPDLCGVRSGVRRRGGRGCEGRRGSAQKLGQREAADGFLVKTTMQECHPRPPRSAKFATLKKPGRRVWEEAPSHYLHRPCECEVGCYKGWDRSCPVQRQVLLGVSGTPFVCWTTMATEEKDKVGPMPQAWQHPCPAAAISSLWDANPSHDILVNPQSILLLYTTRDTLEEHVHLCRSKHVSKLTTWKKVVATLTTMKGTD